MGRRFRHLQELFLKGIILNFASFWGKESPRRFFVSTSLKTRKENEFSFQACGLCAPFPLVRERKTKMTWHVCHFLKRGNLMATAAKHLQKFFAELFSKKRPLPFVLPHQCVVFLIFYGKQMKNSTIINHFHPLTHHNCDFHLRLFMGYRR